MNFAREDIKGMEDYIATLPDNIVVYLMKAVDTNSQPFRLRKPGGLDVSETIESLAACPGDFEQVHIRYESTQFRVFTTSILDTLEIANFIDGYADGTKVLLRLVCPSDYIWCSFKFECRGHTLDYWVRPALRTLEDTEYPFDEILVTHIPPIEEK